MMNRYRCVQGVILFVLTNVSTTSAGNTDTPPLGDDKLNLQQRDQDFNQTPFLFERLSDDINWHIPSFPHDSLWDVGHYFYHPNSYDKHRDLEVISNTTNQVFSSCDDVTEIFRGYYDRVLNGMNLLREYYDCSCDGNLQQPFTMHCTRSDFCFTSPTAIQKLDIDVCINQQNYTFDVIPTGLVGNKELVVSNSMSCIDYKSGGPTSGNFCSKSNQYCEVSLRVDYGWDHESTYLVCNLQDACRPTLEEIGYTKEQAFDLCPQLTLNGQPCRSYVGEILHSNPDFCRKHGQYQLTADCSNVEPCAKPTCRSRNVGENRVIPVYAACSGADLQPEDTTKSTAVALACRDELIGEELSTDPDDNALVQAFDDCVYNGGFFLNPDEVSDCRACFALKVVASRFLDQENCSGYENSVCDIYARSCDAVCGPCSQSGRDLLPCIKDFQYGGQCPLACPSPETDMTVSPSMSPDDNTPPCQPKRSKCRTYQDCCSGRCALGMCLPPLRTPKMFMSKERGGAAGMVKGTRRSTNSNSNGNIDNNSNRNRRAQRQQQVRGSSS